MAKMIQIDQLILGRYLAEDYVAEGGQASVVKALDQPTGNRVVVKQLLASPGDTGYEQALARFQRMAQITLGQVGAVADDPRDLAHPLLVFTTGSLVVSPHELEDGFPFLQTPLIPHFAQMGERLFTKAILGIPAKHLPHRSDEAGVEYVAHTQLARL